MIYQISWIEHAIVRLREDNEKVSSVNGDMTIEDFIREFCGEELYKVIKYQRMMNQITSELFEVNVFCDIVECIRIERQVFNND